MKAASDLSSFDHGQGPCCFWYQRPDGSAALWYKDFFFPFVQKNLQMTQCWDFLVVKKGVYYYLKIENIQKFKFCG